MELPDYYIAESLIGIIVLFYLFIVRPVQKVKRGAGEKPIKDIFFNLVLLSVILLLSSVSELVGGRMPFIAMILFYTSLLALAVSAIGFSIQKEIEKNPHSTRLTLFGVGVRAFAFIPLLYNILHVPFYTLLLWISLVTFIAGLIIIRISKHQESKRG